MAFTSIPTIVTNDVATAGWGNQYLKDNFDAILTSSTTMNTSIITSSITTLGSPMVADITMTDNIKVEFGTGADSAIYYDGTDTFWDLRQAGSGDLMIALAGSFPSPDAGAVHIWAGSAGAVAAHASAQLIVEDAATTYIHLLVPDASSAGLLVGEASTSVRGALIYNNSGASPADTWRVQTGNVDRLHYSSGAFAFQQETTISSTAGDLIFNPTGSLRVVDGKLIQIGTTNEHGTTAGTNLITLDEGTAPQGTIAGAGSLYTATATNVELNYIDSAGNAEQLSTT